MLVISWTERDFWIIRNCRNSFNNKLKKIINQANIQFASKETLEEKGKEVIGMCSLFTWLIFRYLICVIDDIGVFKILSNI